MSSSITEERNRGRSYEVYSGILYTALPSACLKACILQIVLGASQALCALLLLLLLLPRILEWSLPPKLYRKISRIVCEQSGQNKDGVNGVGASAMGVALLWKTALAEANAEHDVTQGWPCLEQVFLFRDAGLLHYVDDICPSNELLKEAWNEGLNGWEISGMRMPTDKHNILPSIMLFDLVHDGFDLFTWARSCRTEAKTEQRVWFSSISTLYVETVGLDSVMIHKLLSFEGKMTECPSCAIHRR